MRNSLRAALACMMAVFAFVGPVSAATMQDQTVAQASTGTISGHVAGDNGRILSNATVIIEGNGQRQTVTTDSSGNYTANLAPGVYTLTVVQAGFQTGSTDVTVAPNSSVAANITLTATSLNTLNVIGRTTSINSANAAKFNISSASVATLSQQQILIRNTPDLTEVVNELPGITIVHATSNINQDFIIRGLRYETKVTLDGHPVSSGTAGTFLTNYASSAIFSGVDVVKGGGLNGPISGEAGAGIVNLHTPDFTSKDTGFLQGGLDQFGGTNYTALANFNLDNNKFQFVFGRSFSGYRGPTYGKDEDFYSGAAIPTLIGQYTTPQLNNGIIGYYQDFSNTYSLNAELAKLRVNFSSATSLAFEFLGLQGRYDPQGGAYGQFDGFLNVPQCLNGTTAGNGAACTATSKYNSPGAQNQIGATVPAYTFYPGSDVRQNQPNFNADFKTTIGNDTILFRPYTAAINRLIDGTQENTIPGDAGGWYEVTNSANCQVNFVAAAAGVGAKGPCYAAGQQPVTAYVTDPTTPHVYAAQGANPLVCTVAKPCYTANTAINNSGQVGFGSPYTTLELDKLFGYTFSYIHPFGANTLNVTFDHYFDDATAYINDFSPLAPGCSFVYSGGNNVAGGLGYQPNCRIGVTAAAPTGVLRATPISVPETFTSVSSAAISATFQLTSKLEADLGGYFTHYLINAQEENPTLLLQYAAAGRQSITPIDFVPSYNSASHFDPRFGLMFRANHDLAFRFTAGSAITIPYASLVSGSLSYAQSTASTTVSSPNYSLRPENTVNLDLGSDWRVAGGTVLSGDIYNINVHNPWISTKVLVCQNTPGCVPAGLEGTAFYSSQTLNGADLIAQGVELQATNEPAVGLGYRVQTSFERAYFMNTPLSYLANPGVFYNGNQLVSTGSTQTAVPYAKGYGEIQYATANHSLFRIGAEYEGANNSYNAPAFWVFDAGVRVNTGFHDVLVGLSAENLFNLNFNSQLGKGTQYQGTTPVALSSVNGQYSALGNTGLVAPNPFTVRFSLTKRF